MGKYKCERCTKNFSQKGHFDRHNIRKYKCKKVEQLVDNIECDNNKILVHNSCTNHNIKCSEHGSNLPELSLKCTENMVTTPILSNNIIESIKSYVCNYCNKNFTRNSSLNRHVSDGRCKSLKEKYNIQINNKNINKNSNNNNNNNNNTVNNNIIKIVATTKSKKPPGKPFLGSGRIFLLSFIKSLIAYILY